jgi:hypothetical protein
MPVLVAAGFYMKIAFSGQLSAFSQDNFGALAANM